ncbi:unnamed protein product [Adineta ricciae]|uniref:G-protein coupled receptors family 1 profile domain-containing protein n=1 Tax=Adineta ricciae TaxID=249248 RepID=A0A815JF70_ADIRI|nr:unnamed protein product [Adineta ricciae]
MSFQLDNTTVSSLPTNDFIPTIPKSRMVIFNFLIVLLVPSILCSIYLFYRILRTPEVRRRDTNLFIICIITINFIQATAELPLSLAFLRLNFAAVASPMFCQWWCFMSASLIGMGLWTTAIGSIERHLFIFHSAFLNNHKLVLHYLPLTCCFVLPVLFYIFLVFLFPCTNEFFYFIFWCGAPCYMYIPFWQVLSWLVDHGTPMLILVIANVVLTIRILRHKRRMQQTQLWSKNARMFFQLISVASLYAICWMPFLVSGQINSFTKMQSPTSLMLFLEYFVYLPYLTTTLCPFVCLFGLWRDLHRGQGFMIVIFHRNRISVEPIVTLKATRRITTVNRK